MLKNAIILIAGVLSFSAAQAACLDGLRVATSAHVLEVVRASNSSVTATVDGERAFATIRQNGSSSFEIDIQTQSKTQLEDNLIQIENDEVTAVTRIVQDDIDFGQKREVTNEVFSVIQRGSCN